MPVDDMDGSIVTSKVAEVGDPPRTESATTIPVLPVQIPGTDVQLARGVIAGRWLFATGQAGTDYINGLAPEVVCAGHPLNGEPKAKREARRIFQNIGDVLQAADIQFEDVVRVDQYYTSADVVDSYHEVRREAFAGKIPPSTSNLHQRFSRLEQSIEVQVMAAIPSPGFRATHEVFQPNYAIHHSSGYSPALSAGEFRFLPGQTAEARSETDGLIDPLARAPRGLWKGRPIKLETEFIIEHKMLPSLQAAGASLDSVVKAQVYLRDVGDVAYFNEAWLSYFPAPPATTIIPTCTPGFIIPDSRIEINVIALASDSSPGRIPIEGPEPPLFDGWVSAIRSGDLLFLSGLMGLKDGRLVAGSLPDVRQPYYAIPVREELRAILGQADQICRAAGTTIANAVRIQQFHTDLNDLPLTLDPWSDAMKGGPLPLSPIEVPWLPVSGARILVDLWVYVPRCDDRARVATAG